MRKVNVEIKAECLNLNVVRSLLLERNAIFSGKDCQIDTYFNTATGRLKLREGDIENYLVYYNRGDRKEPKESGVVLHSTTKGNTASLKETLAESLGIMCVVEKVREIYFIGNIKFHLDTLENLGTFIEIEAQSDAEGADVSALRRQVEEYKAYLCIEDKDLVSGSYSDMLMEK